MVNTMKDLHFSTSISALFLAVLLWGIIGLNDPVQVSLKIPVSVSDGPKEEAVITNAPVAVNATIRASGWRVLRCMFDPTVRLSIPRPSPRNRMVLSTVEVLEQMDAFSRGVVFIDAVPRSITIVSEKAVSKRIPIQPILLGKFREGFDRVGPIHVTPDSVTITGASSVLSTIERWPTTPIQFHDINTPFVSTVTLSDSLSMFVQRSVSSTQVGFEVQPTAEQMISGVPVELIQVPERKKIILIPNVVDVIIRGGVNTLSALPVNDIKATIDYRSILLDTSGTVTPTINTPENITVVRIAPDKVQYILRQ